MACIGGKMWMDVAVDTSMASHLIRKENTQKQVWLHTFSAKRKHRNMA